MEVGCARSELPFKEYSSKINRDLLDLPDTIILIDEDQETYDDSVLWSEFKVYGIIFSPYGLG